MRQRRGNAPLLTDMRRNSTVHEGNFSITALDSSSLAPVKEAEAVTAREQEPSGETEPSLFPVDIWVEILLRIPAEDLVKLKIVCRRWYELITNESFAYSHLDRWKSRSINGFAVHMSCSCCHRNHLRLLPPSEEKSSIIYFTLHSSGDEEELRGRHFLIQNCYHYSRETELTTEMRLLASCDGLLLIGYARENHYQLFICNPITKSYRRLPVFQPTDTRYLWWSVSCEYEWAMARNVSNGQYKVFGLQRFPVVSQRKCYIFELQRESEERARHDWKELDAILPAKYWMITSSTTTEGRVHWFALKSHPDEVKILSIDTSTDEVRAMASIRQMPGTYLCVAWNGAVYCMQWYGSRRWALENYNHPTWVEKDDRNNYNYHDRSISRSMEELVTPGAARSVMDLISCLDNDGVLERVVPHVSSLVSCR